MSDGMILADRLRSIAREIAVLADQVAGAPHPHAQQRIRIGPHELDDMLGVLHRADGTSVILSRSEHAILSVLVDRRGSIATHADILAAIGQAGALTRTASTHMSNIRRKIGADVITTVWGRGWRLRDQEAL